jgi:hypothetical protein
MEYSTKMYFQLTTARCIVLQKNKKKTQTNTRPCNESTSSCLLQYWPSKIVATAQPISASVQLGVYQGFFWCICVQYVVVNQLVFVGGPLCACVQHIPHDGVLELVVDRYIITKTSDRPGMYHLTTQNYWVHSRGPTIIGIGFWLLLVAVVELGIFSRGRLNQHH